MDYPPIAVEAVSRRARPAKPARGFSLVELLLVTALIALLATLSLPAIHSITTGMRLTAATQMVVDEIQGARAIALSRNEPAEVWFLREGENNPVQIVRTLSRNADGSATWASPARRLPQGIEILEAPDYSNIVGAQSMDAPGGAPAGLTGAGLRIHPSGRSELTNSNSIAPNSLLFLTIAPANSAGAEPSEPFATVQVHPVHARVTTFRP